MADAFTPIDPAATSLERSESRRRRRRQQDNGVGAAGELTLVNTPPPVNPSNCSSPALSSARSPSLSPAPDIPPSLLIKSVEITRLTAINENFGTFEAQIFVKCLFVGGADDPHLSAKGVDGNLSTPLFPIGADGRPTFKPNAAWYLDKLIFANMYAHPKAQVKERDNEVRIEGNDLAITIYSEGSFYEKFELHDFPFDAQDLTFELCMNVRVDGPVGCRLEVNRTTHSELLVAGFYLSDCWSLHKHMGGTLLIGCDNHDGGRSGELSEKSIKQGPSNLPAGSCAEPRSKTRAKIRASMAASKSASSNFGAKMSKVMMGRSITKFWGSTVGSSSSDGTKFWGSGSCDEMTEAEAEPTRKFPSAFFTLKVARRYHYYLWNIIMPSFLFVPLAFLQVRHLSISPSLHVLPCPSMPCSPSFHGALLSLLPRCPALTFSGVFAARPSPSSSSRSATARASSARSLWCSRQSSSSSRSSRPTTSRRSTTSHSSTSRYSSHS